MSWARFPAPLVKVEPSRTRVSRSGQQPRAFARDSKIGLVVSISPMVVRLSAEGETNAMEYLLLIYDNEADLAKRSEAEQAAIYQDYAKFTQSIQQSGNHRAGQQLQPVSTATTVRVRNGKRVVTDGPFAETREQLGGFYWIQAKDLDEALAIAERIPSARIGSIEVRPLVSRNSG
jgi:hypothetical protein